MKTEEVVELSDTELEAVVGGLGGKGKKKEEAKKDKDAPAAAAATGSCCH
jgi:hypothetical protein